MGNRTPWDKLEAVLLLDTILLIKDKKISRNEAITKVSRLLRRRALKMGLTIDEKFRNTNGIALQMMNMKKVLDSIGAISSGNKMFDSLVELYLNNNSEYNELVRESSHMISGLDNYKDDFFHYVVYRKADWASKIFWSFGVMDSYALSLELIENPMFDCLDENVLNVVEDMLDNNKDFRKINGKAIVFGKMGLSLLKEYIAKYGYPTDNEEELDDEPKSLADSKTYENDINIGKSKIPDEPQEKYVDFQNLLSYKYTTPLYFEIENQREDSFNNWTVFYVTLVETLWNNYSGKLSEYVGKSLINGSRVDLNDTDDRMIAPKRITDELYLETNLSAIDIIKRVSAILDICDINKSEVSIAYKEKGKGASSEGSNKESRRINDDDKFIRWMVDTRNLAPATSRSYRSAINACDSVANQNGIYVGSACELSVDEFDVAYTALVNDEDFKEINIKRHNAYTAALKACREYLLSADDETEPFSVDNEKTKDTNLEISEEFRDLATQILKKSFEDGYRISNYIDQMNFLSEYEDAGGEIPCAPEELDLYLRKVGIIIDNCIFAKDNEKQSELLDTVFTDVENAFKNGATAIYLSQLYEKYKKMLAEINLYNFDSLCSLMSSDSRFSEDYLYSSGTLRKPKVLSDIDLEVENCLKHSAQPMIFTDICGKLWYLPLEKIKGSILRNSKIVNVDENKYFYAPNFNISSDELAQLVRAIDIRLNEDSLISKSTLRDIFRENCPLAAADSEEYKNFAIKKILGVLIGDKFNFGSAGVTKNDGFSDSTGVFRSYAREHETLTLSQIRDFADEVKINIYWKPLLREIVRVTNNSFVRNDKIHFDTEAVDNVLDDLCPNDYIPLKQIDLFLSFPDVGYKWNGFLLESYLRGFSKQFRLIQTSFSIDDYFGVIVRKSSNLKTYDDVAADWLAHRDDWNDEKSAVECLVNAAFQQRRSYKNIASVIKQAKLIRAKLENEGRKH